MQMHLKKIYIFLFAFLVVFSAGCRSNPVYNVEGAAVISGKTNASLDDVQKAIMRAGGTLGWVMTPAGSGEVLGTLRLRKHVAVVSIKFNARTYSILYKSSENLDYDGKNIHSNYNGWIQNLHKAIQAQLTHL